ncbi:MAG TPA: hypothetical protein VJI33_04990 [Candidatus Paceibacterota bacterium]
MGWIIYLGVGIIVFLHAALGKKSNEPNGFFELFIGFISGTIFWPISLSLYLATKTAPFYD